MNTKKITTSFGEVTVKQLSVLDKLNFRMGSEKSFIELGLDDASRKLLAENAGTKEDLNLIADTISEVNGWNTKVDDPK